jgi:hypothetical protein
MILICRRSSSAVFRSRTRYSYSIEL